MSSVGKVTKHLLFSTSQNLGLLDVSCLPKLRFWRDNARFGKQGSVTFSSWAEFSLHLPKWLKWPGSLMFLFLFAVALSLFVGHLTFQWTLDLQRAKFQVGGGFRRKTTLLSCAWHFTWEMGISTRNYCVFLISSEKALCLNPQKLKIGRLILIDRVGKAVE